MSLHSRINFLAVTLTVLLPACMERDQVVGSTEETKLYPIYTDYSCSNDEDCQAVPVGAVSRCEEFDAINRQHVTTYVQRRNAQSISDVPNCEAELSILEPFCEREGCKQRKKKDYSCAETFIPGETVELTSFLVDPHSITFGHATSDLCLAWPGPKTAHGDEATFVFKAKQVGKYRITLRHDGTSDKYIFIGSGVGDCGGMSSMSCVYCPADTSICDGTFLVTAAPDNVAIIAIRNCNQDCRLMLEYLDPSHTLQRR